MEEKEIENLAKKCLKDVENEKPDYQLLEILCKKLLGLSEEEINQTILSGGQVWRNKHGREFITGWGNSMQLDTWEGDCCGADEDFLDEGDVFVGDFYDVFQRIKY